MAKILIGVARNVGRCYSMVVPTKDMRKWVVGDVYQSTPRVKYISGCLIDADPHLHAQDAYGNFSVCTESYEHVREAGRALYEMEHDL